MMPFRRFTECKKLKKVIINGEEKLMSAGDNETGPNIFDKDY